MSSPPGPVRKGRALQEDVEYRAGPGARELNPGRFRAAVFNFGGRKRSKVFRSSIATHSHPIETAQAITPGQAARRVCRIVLSSTAPRTKP